MGTEPRRPVPQQSAAVRRHFRSGPGRPPGRDRTNKPRFDLRWCLGFLNRVSRTGNADDNYAGARQELLRRTQADLTWQFRQHKAIALRQARARRVLADFIVEWRVVRGFAYQSRARTEFDLLRRSNQTQLKQLGE